MVRTAGALYSMVHMARNRRPRIDGGVYHVMNRGNRKSLIFEDERDRHRFMQILEETCAAYQVEVIISQLMGNHFHLVVCTPLGNLSAFMQQLEGQFAQYSNWRHDRVGHLFQDRFKAVVIENDIHLFTAFWYVATNPVAARYVQRPQQWRWSTYRATVGMTRVPPYVTVNWVEVLFPAATLCESQRLCRKCMDAAQPVQAYLAVCEPDTAAAVRSYIAERLSEVVQPCTLNVLLRPPLGRLFPELQDRQSRKKAVTMAHNIYRYSLVEIARHLGVHPATASKIYCTAKRRR